MKKLKRINCIVCVFLIVAFLTGCSSPSDKLHSSLRCYERITRGDIPSDIQLTIYYADPMLLTRTPLSVEALKSHPATEKIIVQAEELAPYWEEFQKLNSSVLQPTQEDPLINARLYYVLETSTSQKVLEVAQNGFNYNLGVNGYDFIINGIEVEYNSLFLELIWPFLSGDARTFYAYKT